MNEETQRLCVTSPQSLREVMSCIDRGGLGVALLVDDQFQLLRTITDGDIRRAILDGTELDAPVADLPEPGHPTVTAPVGTTYDEQRQIMARHAIRHLPLLHADRTVSQLATLESTTAEAMPLQGVIMAGGFGTRLRPLTDDTPKPMLSIGGKPLMERTIENFQKAGIHRINVTTHYLPHKITQHFGNGRKFGVEMNYVSEDQPLGTAGALRLMDKVDEPLLVINGDILTEVDLRALSKFHREQEAALTVAVRQYNLDVPYGVVETNRGVVQRLREKPRLSFLVNAGIYLLEPHVRKYIPADRRYDMTDLIEALIDERETVAGFPITEYWRDIGKHDDFQQAQQDIIKYRRAA